MNVLFFLIFACGEQKSDKTDSASEPSSDEENINETEEGNEEEGNEEENNEQENNEQENNEEVNEENISCSELTLDECDTYEGCETLSGHPIVIVNEEECVDSSTQEVKACVETGCSAEPTITVAHPPDSDQCWLFPSGCLPQSWELCGSSPQDCQ